KPACIAINLDFGTERGNPIVGRIEIRARQASLAWRPPRSAPVSQFVCNQAQGIDSGAMANSRRRPLLPLECGEIERSRIKSDSCRNKPCLSAMNRWDKRQYGCNSVSLSQIAKPGFPILPQSVPIACTGDQEPFDKRKIP